MATLDDGFEFKTLEQEYGSLENYRDSLTERANQARRGENQNKTSSQSLYDRLETPKRQHTTLSFPDDLETEGSKNIMRFNISLPSGSKYLGNGAYQKAIDPSTGEAQTSEYRSGNNRGSIARRFSGNYTRIQKTIDLYMPPQIQSSYQSDWNVSELGVLGAGMDAFGGIANNDGIGAAAEQAWNVMKDAAPSIASNTIAGVVQGLTPINAKDAKSVMDSTVSNPYMEVIFNGVQHRTFSFTFKMIPKNRDEQARVRDIVNEFKFHRAPEYKSDLQNLYMIFPSEFDITFLNNNEENPWIFKISTCALTNCTVNHSPEGQFAAHEGGAPFATELTLEFTEMQVHTKESHREGGY